MIPVPLAAILGAIIVWMVSLAGASFWAYGAGGRAEEATQLREDVAIAKTREVAAQAVAQAISEIEVKNTTIRQRVETVIREKPIYRDCVHAPEQLRDVNQALTGSDTPDRGKLPADDKAH